MTAESPVTEKRTATTRREDITVAPARAGNFSAEALDPIVWKVRCAARTVSPSLAPRGVVRTFSTDSGGIVGRAATPETRDFPLSPFGEFIAYQIAVSHFYLTESQPWQGSAT